MSKRQERNERRIERMESYLSYLASQINMVLPAADLAQIESRDIFDPLSEVSFIWDEGSSVNGIQRSDYNYFVNKIYPQLPEILVPETRSGMSSEKALDLGFLTTIMSAYGLGDPYSSCGPEVRRLVYHQLKGKPGFDSVRHIDGVVTLIQHGEVIPTKFTIRDLPVSYFKWGFLKLEESKIMPDFSSGLIDSSYFKDLLQKIKMCMNESEHSFRTLGEGELKINDSCALHITKDDVILVTLSLGQVAVKMRLHESRSDGDFTVTIKSDNDMSDYKHVNQAYNRIMSNDVSYVDAINIINSLLSIEELLTSPKFKETLLVLEVGV